MDSSSDSGILPSSIPVDEDYRHGRFGAEEEVEGAISEYATVSADYPPLEDFEEVHPFPSDELLDEPLEEHEISMHEMMLLLLDNRYYLSPIKASSLNCVADVGTGFGLWAEGVAEKYPKTTVVGIDIRDHERSSLPNYSLLLNDATEEWILDDPLMKFDLIHMRNLSEARLGRYDMHKLYKHCFNNMNPGGWIEQVEIDFEALTDDNSELPMSQVKWLNTFLTPHTSSRQFVGISSMMKTAIEEAGFVKVQKQRVKLPLGPWPSDQKFKDIGRFCERWYKTGLLRRLFSSTQATGWTIDQVNRECVKAFQEINTRQQHFYFRLLIVIGQKPTEGSPVEFLKSEWINENDKATPHDLSSATDKSEFLRIDHSREEKSQKLHPNEILLKEDPEMLHGLDVKASAELPFTPALTGNATEPVPNHVPHRDAFNNLGMSYQNPDQMAATEQTHERDPTIFRDRPNRPASDKMTALEYRASGQAEAVATYSVPLPGYAQSQNKLGLNPATTSDETIAAESTPSLTFGSTQSIFSNELYKLAEARVDQRVDIVAADALESEESTNWQKDSDLFDLRSIRSLDDDINSLYADSITSESRVAQMLISQKFAKQAIFSALCVEALSKMSKQRLTRNLSKLLKRYYLQLRKQSRSQVEDVATVFLKARSARNRIAGAILDRVDPPSIDIEQRNQEEDRFIDREGRQKVEEWLKARPESYVGMADTRINEYMPAHNSESSSEEDDVEAGPVQPLESMDGFFFDGQAFSSFLVALRSFSRPPSSPSLMRILLSLPERDITVIDRYKASWTDRTRLWMQHFTNEVWDWWPLRPPKPDLAPGFSRILWTCHCGEVLWQDISKSDWTEYSAILQLRGDWRSSDHLCLQGTQKSSHGHQVRGNEIAHASHGTEPSRNGSTTSTVSNTSSNNNSSLSGPSSATSPWAGSTHGPIQNSMEHAPGQAIMISSRSSSYVLLGVEDREGSVNIAHLNTAKIKNDGQFFASLKVNHDLLRGLWRRYFSIWRFTYCDFVKFQKFRAHEIRTHCEELPSQPDYEYRPRPPDPDAELPAISLHEFRKSLRPCTTQCQNQWYSCLVKAVWSHKCFMPSEKDYAMERTPKKREEWLIGTENIEYAWGLKSGYQPSALRVLLYHLAILSPGIAIMIQWLLRAPMDLQDASVVLTLELGGLSLFWALFVALKRPTW